jgi:peptide/nickel transport system substrate-binding protein
VAALRRWQLVMAVLVVVLLLVPAAGIGQTPGSLRLAITRDEGHLNPYTYQTGYPGWNLMTLVYDTLFYPDANNEPIPWLVRNAQVSRDGRTWTLTLHPNIRWHDGRALTSEDVKFTFEYIIKVAHSRWTPPARVIERVDAPNPTTVVFQLKNADAGFRLRALADVPILPKHIWESVTTVPAARALTNVVGSGPYMVAEAQPAQFYRLTANPQYFAGQPRVRELILPVIRDATVSFTALQAAQIEANVRTLPPELVAQFERLPGMKVVRGAGFASTLLQFNMEHPLLKDPKLRQAIANTINTRLMVRLLMLGFAVVGSPGYLHPDSPLSAPGVKFEANKAKAVTLLNEAGYRDRNNDGIREAQDGTPLRFTLLTLAGNPIRIRGAELIRTWLRDVGIDTTVRVQEDAAIIDQVWPEFDVCKGRRFDMAVFGWSAPVMTRPTALRDLFHSDCNVGVLNIGGYKNPQIDRMGEQLAITVDPARQKQIATEMQKVIAQDLPVHVLFYPDTIMAYRQAAYDRWAFRKGEGILTKLSFVDPPR